MNALRVFGRSTWWLLRAWQREVRRGWPGLLLFAVFAVSVALWAHRWDPEWESWASTHQHDDLLSWARFLSDWGRLHLAPLLGLGLLAVVGFWRRSLLLRWAALAGLLSGCLGGIVANVGKIIVGRPRPSTLGVADGAYWFRVGYDYASFPSGHATHCMAVAAAVVVLAPRSGALMILVSLAVGWSRWYLLRHYLTDVWAGSCLGLAIGLLFGLAAKRLLSVKPEYTPSPSQPPAAE